MNKNIKQSYTDYERKALNILRNHVMPYLDKAVEAGAGVEDGWGGEDGDAIFALTLAQVLADIIDSLSVGEYTLTDECEDVLQSLFDLGQYCEKIGDWCDKNPNTLGAIEYNKKSKMPKPWQDNRCRFAGRAAD